VLTRADVDYIRANYFTLEELCASRKESPDEVSPLIRAGRLPRPAYVLDDGREMFPADYFVFVDQAGGHAGLRTAFERRYAAAGGTREELEADWEGYLSGLFAVCLKVVVPETRTRKEQLVRSIGSLLESPAPEEAVWRARLRREVWELDVLERDFSPDYDRRRFEVAPTRDRLIAAARKRYPEVVDAG
jgi:Family of unknown function (DUF6058)